METGSSSELLISSEQLGGRARELGAEISGYYASVGVGEISTITILKGSFIFLADLIRCIDIPLTLDFMAISSYSQDRDDIGIARLTKDLSLSIRDRDVLMVEDVIDTGLTLAYIIKILRERGPRSIEVCTLLDRSRNRIADLPIRFRGFEVEDQFVVGYGLDYDQRYRNLPDIRVLGAESLRKKSGMV
jgi:hypoxanthine phosphoribosyltransferase